MIQYKTSNSIKVSNKKGAIVDIIPFRNRVAYPDNFVVSQKLTQGNYNRPDILANEIYGSFGAIGALIDANEKDIFSFQTGDRIEYPLKEVAIV